MPFGDGIDRINCFSLSDFHDYQTCSFKFFVLHHLNKKYELAEGNESLALGSLLDEAIKLFHKTKSYNCPPEYIANLIKASCSRMTDKIERSSGPSFFSAIEDYLNDETCQKAAQIFVDYYEALNRKIKKSLTDVGFCEWVIKDNGSSYKLWGGPDTIEEGDDGMPEICDYKFRENLERGKSYMDMDLMPKIYTLLCSKKLISLGYKKARFIVRFWQDPKDNSFYEEFDLEKIKNYEEYFKQMILKIINTTELNFCQKNWCSVCNSDQKQIFLKELEDKGFIKVNLDSLFSPMV